MIPAEFRQLVPSQLYKRKVPENLMAKVVNFAKIRPKTVLKELLKVCKSILGL